jgi:hypothetical protein
VFGLAKRRNKAIAPYIAPSASPRAQCVRPRQAAQ